MRVIIGGEWIDMVFRRKKYVMRKTGIYDTLTEHGKEKFDSIIQYKTGWTIDLMNYFNYIRFIFYTGLLLLSSVVFMFFIFFVYIDKPYAAISMIVLLAGGIVFLLVSYILMYFSLVYISKKCLNIKLNQLFGDYEEHYRIIDNSLGEK